MRSPIVVFMNSHIHYPLTLTLTTLSHSHSYPHFPLHIRSPKYVREAARKTSAHSHLSPSPIRCEMFPNWRSFTLRRRYLSNLSLSVCVYLSLSLCFYFFTFFVQSEYVVVFTPSQPLPRKETITVRVGPHVSLKTTRKTTQ